jgi:hypothetical protein
LWFTGRLSMASVARVGVDLIELADRLAEGERWCATTADDAMRRDYEHYTAELARAVALFKAKLSRIMAAAPLLTPELKEWALSQTANEVIVAGLTEVREQRGVDLGEVIQKLKQKRHARERTNP